MPFVADRIDHVEVFVRSIDASVRWYKDVLGLTEYFRGDPEPVMIGAGGTKLALFTADSGADPPRPSKARDSLRWRLVAWLTTPEGLERAQQHLSRQGVAFDGPIDHGGPVSIYFTDLDGHPLEITCYPES